MKATILRQYDRTTSAWKGVSTPVPENFVPPTDIANKGLFTVVALQGRQPRATNQAAKNPATGGTIQKAPPPPKTPSQQTSSKTSDQGSLMFQSGDGSPLTDPGARKQPNKKTASQGRQRGEGCLLLLFLLFLLAPPLPNSSSSNKSLLRCGRNTRSFKPELPPLETGNPPVPPRVTSHQYYHSPSRTDAHVHHSFRLGAF
ncbi:hypothetical protein MRX96_040075 [Rhipicephalus microplus]